MRTKDAGTRGRGSRDFREEKEGGEGNLATSRNLHLFFNEFCRKVGHGSAILWGSNSPVPLTDRPFPLLRLVVRAGKRGPIPPWDDPA